MAKWGKTFNRIRKSLWGPASHELLVFCFFLAVSFGFWLLQALNETLERDVQVNLELEGVPPDVVIIDSLPRTLTVTLRDRGIALARHSLYSLLRPNNVKVDFAKFGGGQSEAEVYLSASDVSRMLSHLFNASTRIQAYHPDTLYFAYNRGMSRMLPVKLAGTFKTSSQNYLQSIRTEPDSVRVYAPVAVLDTMQAAYSESFLLEDLRESGTHTIALRRDKFVKHEPEQVSVHVRLGYYTEKSLQVPIIGLNFPAGKKLRTFPQNATVTFRIESGRYNRVTADDFVIATTYEELIANSGNSRMVLHLKTLPEGVSDVRISPQDADYLIEQTMQE